MGDLLNAEQLEGPNAYCRASNYLAVGRIYLRGNALLNRWQRHEVAPFQAMGSRPDHGRRVTALAMSGTLPIIGSAVRSSQPIR